MFLKTTISFLILILILFGSNAQNSYYPYYSADTIARVKLADECCNKVGSSYILPDYAKKEYKKDFIAIKTESVDYTKSLIKYTNISDSLLNPFIQSVYKKITDGNPALSGYTIVLSDWPIMNAANVGGKVVVFYVPLLSRLENESEVAAILCHELAHGELDHVQKGIKKYLDDFYSKDFQKELKTTMKEEFNVNSKMNLLALKFTFGSRYHSRTSEKAADSLGYIFLSRTSYDATQAINALEVLKHVDESPTQESFDYVKYFKCPTATFDFNTIKPYKKKSLFEVSGKSDMDTLIDSLRTHPDCAKRIAFVQELMKSIPPKTPLKTDSSYFRKIQWAAAMEMIQSYFDYDYYDYALFNALAYLQKKQEDEYLSTIITLTLSGLYEAMKNHELSDYVSNYSEENPDALNDLIALINNIRLNELSSIINCAYETRVAKINENEYSIAAGYVRSKINDDGKTTFWQEKYRTSVKKGRLKYLMNLDPKPTTKKKK